MITVENDYGPVIYEQLFTSHIYENQLELLHNYYIGPTDTIQTTQKVNEINPMKKVKHNAQTQIIFIKIYRKNNPEKKFVQYHFYWKAQETKNFNHQILKLILTDSGAESNIINIPTWNEIQTLHPELTPLETSSKLATAQGSTLVNYGKIQLFLLPTRTMEQNKILNRPFKQTFHITDIKHNIFGIPFIIKYIPTINILNKKTTNQR